MINLFHKLCFASNGADLELLLTTAIGNNDRDTYLVFLDALEETNPKARAKLEDLGDNINEIMNILSINFSNLIKSDGPYKYIFNFNTPGFSDLYKITTAFAWQMFIYRNKFLVDWSIKTLHGNVIFNRDTAPIINNELIQRLTTASDGICAYGFGDSNYITDIDESNAEDIYRQYVGRANADYLKLKELLAIPANPQGS